MSKLLRLAGLSLATIIVALALLGLLGNGYVVAQQILYGIAGTPDPHVVTVQGISGATPQPVTITGVTTGGATPYHLAGGSAASTNATSIVTGAHTLKSLSLVNTQASTIAYLRLYDVNGAPTCSSATGAKESIPVISGPGGIAVPMPAEGWAFASGISFCITGGGADTDNTNAPTGVFVIASYQ